MNEDFRPTASLDMLRRRSDMLRAVRRFFQDDGFIEVETPILSRDVVVDRYLQPISVPAQQMGLAEQSELPFYLQTSPEFAMKRLLASGAQAIYQIGHAFRAGEAGALHNPEFTMLEWYRIGDDMHAGIDRLAALVESILHVGPCRRIRYADVFRQYADLDVFSDSIETFRQAARRCHLDVTSLSNESDLDVWRNFFLTQLVEPNLGHDCPSVVFDWPASQAALAKIRYEDPPVAERFELYFRGLELANGYNELLDADELIRRNEQINQQRLRDESGALPVNSRMCQAMRSGLPACSGVALGVDRLLMVATDSLRISDVMAFPIDRA